MTSNLYVFPGGQQDPRKELSAGHYVFPFQAQIPTNLPSSFEGIIKANYVLNDVLTL